MLLYILYENSAGSSVNDAQGEAAENPANGDDTAEEPGENTEEEKGFFEKLIEKIRDFFKKVIDFIKPLFD